MAEGQVGAEPVVEPAVEAQPAPSLVGSDGTLREGWRDTLDEDIREEKCLQTVKNFNGAMRSYVDARKAYGKEKIAIPNEASSDAEWDTFHAAGGRPETAGDYALARPEELPEEYYSQELATAAQDLFHKIGLNKKQADALFAFNNNNVIAQLATNAQNDELSATELKDKLYSDWGNAFEQKKHLGNVAVEQGTNGDVEFKERLTQKFGNDPDFIRYSANLGAKFSEAGSPDAKTIPTPDDIQTTIDDEIVKPVYGTDYAKHGFTKAQHQAQVKKVSLLFQEKTKHIKTG